MPRYVQLGKVPQKKHTQFRKPDGTLYTEQMVSTYGFSGPLSTLYHINLPTRVKNYEDLGPCTPTFLEDEALRHRHLHTANMVPLGNALSGRIPIMGNHDLIWYQAVVAEPMQNFYKNAQGDEMLFVHDGKGVFESCYGNITIKPGDYIVIPRGTPYRVIFNSYPVKMIILETQSAIEIPKRYLNTIGQLLEHAPYSERDIRPPHELITHDEKGEFFVDIKMNGRMTRYTYDYHPFDVIGWDGYAFPWAFNINDFSPITGKVHMPPPIHQTFESSTFVVCSFCPRMLDYHPQSIPVPYVHSNVDSEEVIYYCNSRFGSRTGISEGSITIHPRGIPHGPQPGVVEASLGAKSTEELAVMVDTFHPLKLTAEALKLEDPNYWKSWLK